jgi:enoyl-CoA hydratase/carnithine racemase
VSDIDVGGHLVRVVRFDRPERKNAIDLAVIDALLAAMRSNPARVVVLRSDDPRCFCAGADRSIDAGERALVSDRLYELYGVMIGLTAPIIAECGGYAIGGGAQIAMAADIRIGNAATEFRFVGAGHGLAVGSWILPALIGRGRALALTMTMGTVRADEALRIGLLDALDVDALELAARIASSDAGALARLKRVSATAGNLVAALEQERSENRATWSGVLASG